MKYRPFRDFNVENIVIYHLRFPEWSLDEVSLLPYIDYCSCHTRLLLAVRNRGPAKNYTTSNKKRWDTGQKTTGLNRRRLLCTTAVL